MLLSPAQGYPQVVCRRYGPFIHKAEKSFFSRKQETHVELELKIPTRYSASPVTSKCNSDPPAEVDRKERSKRPPAKNLLGYWADAKRLGGK